MPSRPRASPGGWTSCGSSSLCVRSARSLCVRSARNGVRAIDAQVLVLQFRVARAQECLRVQSAYEWVSACAESKEECLHGTCVPQSWQGDGKPELNDAVAPRRDVFLLAHPSDRPRRSLNSRKRRESPVGEFQVFNFGCLVRALHAAAMRRLPGAVAGAVRARGLTVQGSGAGSGRAARLAGHNKPAKSQLPGPRIPAGHHPVPNPDVGRAP